MYGLGLTLIIIGSCFLDSQDFRIPVIFILSGAGTCLIKYTKIAPVQQKGLDDEEVKNESKYLFNESTVQSYGLENGTGKWEERVIKRKIIMFLLIAAILAGSRIQAKAETKETIYGQAESFTVYGYDACESCCGKTDGVTSTGTTALQGRTIAVDPEVIPLGSTVLIYYDGELVGIYQAEDTGGDIKGKVIDLYHDTHEAAKEWGKKQCTVIVIDAKG